MVPSSASPCLLLFNKKGGGEEGCVFDCPLILPPPPSHTQNKSPNSRRPSPCSTRMAMVPSPPRNSALSCAVSARTPLRPNSRCVCVAHRAFRARFTCPREVVETLRASRPRLGRGRMPRESADLQAREAPYFCESARGLGRTGVGRWCTCLVRPYTSRVCMVAASAPCRRTWVVGGAWVEGEGVW